MQNGSSVEICTHCIHIFARLAPICMLSRCLLTTFLHRSSVRSLSRVRCWLGTSHNDEKHPLLTCIEKRRSYLTLFKRIQHVQLMTDVATNLQKKSRQSPPEKSGIFFWQTLSFSSHANHPTSHLVGHVCTLFRFQNGEMDIRLSDNLARLSRKQVS